MNSMDEFRFVNIGKVYLSEYEIFFGVIVTFLNSVNICEIRLKLLLPFVTLDIFLVPIPLLMKLFSKFAMISQTK